MRYRVVLQESEEGFAVSVPGLPGCHSQGVTEAEALDNIKSAIAEYLSVVEEQLQGKQIREVDVSVQRLGNLPGVSHLEAIRAFKKAGFAVVRQGKHTVMSDGERILVIPRHNPINGITMAAIVRDAGLTEREFRKLL